jgi:hypothetical protein
VTENIKRGTVETYAEVYEPLKQLGVSPSVWDEVLSEIFAAPFGELPVPFQELLFELEVGKKTPSDYPRTEGASDHDYVRGILRRAEAESKAKGLIHAQLMNDEGFEYDERLGVSKKMVPN